MSPASDEDIELTRLNLEGKGHSAFVVADSVTALELVKSLIPSGSSISCGHSTTLIEVVKFARLVFQFVTFTITVWHPRMDGKI